MRKTVIRTVATAAILALSACSDSSSKGADVPGGVEPNKAAAQLAFQFQPGKYRATVEVSKFDVPGMPTGMGEQMKAMMSKTAASEYCMSAEQAAKGLEAMKDHMGQGKCQFEKFDAAGGRVSSVFTCETGQGMGLRSVSEGTYTATGSKVAAKAEMTGPGGRVMHVEQTVTTERIGDCS